jgi:hypothetical protein
MEKAKGNQYARSDRPPNLGVTPVRVPTQTEHGLHHSSSALQAPHPVKGSSRIA